jgi:hypothetical protein
VWSLAPPGGYVSGSIGAPSISAYPPNPYDGSDGVATLISDPEGRLAREHAEQSKLVTRRRAFDEFLYERKHGLTWEDDRERLQGEELRRSRTDPPVNEITSAQALNTLLDHLQKLDARGVTGREVPLDEDVLSRVNVSFGRGGHLGLLKNGGRLSWPLALTDDAVRGERKQVDSLLAEVLSQTSARPADADAITEMTRTSDRLQQYLAERSKNLPPGQYVEAKRFLTDLGQALRALQQPEAAEHLSRKTAPHDKTVAELIRSMTRQGLHFAPAVNGDEAAYVALHRALVRYDASTQR